MTNPNWWDEEPFYKRLPCEYHSNQNIVEGCGGCELSTNGRHNIPAIIAEVEKRGETKKAKVITSDGIESEWSCSNCKNELSHTEIDGSYCLWCGAEFE